VHLKSEVLFTLFESVTNIISLGEQLISLKRVVNFVGSEMYVLAKFVDLHKKGPLMRKD